MIELPSRDAVSALAFEESFQSASILTFIRYLLCPIGNRIMGPFCYWLCSKPVINASDEYWADSPESWSPLSSQETDTQQATSIPLSCNVPQCWLREDFLPRHLSSPALKWDGLSLGAQIPVLSFCFDIDWCPWASCLGWVGRCDPLPSLWERMNEIPMFSLLYWNHKVWRKWMFEMYYQPQMEALRADSTQIL